MARNERKCQVVVRKSSQGTPPALSFEQQEKAWLKKRIQCLERELAAMKHLAWRETGPRVNFAAFASWNEEMKVFALERLGDELQEIGKSILPEEPSARLVHTSICTNAFLQASLKPEEQVWFISDMVELAQRLSNEPVLKKAFQHEYDK